MFLYLNDSKLCDLQSFPELIPLFKEGDITYGDVEEAMAKISSTIQQETISLSKELNDMPMNKVAERGIALQKTFDTLGILKLLLHTTKFNTITLKA